jgi:hypothetical protein
MFGVRNPEGVSEIEEQCHPFGITDKPQRE